MTDTRIAEPVVDISTRVEPPARTPRRSRAEIGLFFVPIVILVWMGWQHRWMCDDAFINFRIVKQILAGHGPVFNTGQRVEAATSPLWVGVLAVLDLVTPFRLESISVVASIAATAGGLAFAMVGTRRALLALGVTGTFIPLGALVYVALPPAWDFATSGLEVGLSVLWLGLAWWCLTGRLAPDSTRSVPWKPWWVPVVLGLGPLIRPDFLVFSVFFLAALLLLAGTRAGWRSHVAALALAGAVPVGAELFRMAYYGNVVPNTALAKEGSLSSWSRGWYYLRDFVEPHLLLVPLAVLACFVLLLLASRRSSVRGAQIVFGLTIAAGLTHCLYVVRVGGDYMHARMLVPTLFALLLPVSVVAVRTWRWIAVAVVVVWAIASASTLRPAYSTSATVNGAFDPSHLISDERLVQIRLTNVAHPVTLADFTGPGSWATAGLVTKEMVMLGERGLLLNPYTMVLGPSALLPLRSDVHAPIVAFVGAVGVYAYAAGTSVEVVDSFGIVDWLSAHQTLRSRGRAGHEKVIPPAWMFARFADPRSVVPLPLTSQDVDAARRAFSCGEFPDLIASTEGSLSPARLFDNFTHALGLSRFRFDSDPQVAERRLCTT
jgi:arabinofuranosyltransferase